jgi:plasmid stabilization system protein ParE
VIVFDAGALDDLERIFEFHFEHDPRIAIDHVRTIRSAVLMLDTHPWLGRLTARGSTLRELVISRGHTGYIALYEYSPIESMVRIVAIRHQREAGYRGD